VPNYLEGIPQTGISGHEAYSYESGPKLQEIYGRPWLLEVKMFEFLGWDTFFYAPEFAKADGYPYEQIGDWVYFRE
jgi:hypothetical protein